jgi:hypothetical protein
MICLQISSTAVAKYYDILHPRRPREFPKKEKKSLLSAIVQTSLKTGIKVIVRGDHGFAFRFLHFCIFVVACRMCMFFSSSCRRPPAPHLSHTTIIKNIEYLDTWD